MTLPVQSRPTGITILAVLAGLGGVLGIIAGLAVFGIGAAFGPAGIGLILALVVLVTAVADLALAQGFRVQKPWAWTLAWPCRP